MNILPPNGEYLTPEVKTALEAADAQLAGFWSAEHRANGTHKVQGRCIAFHNTTQTLADATWTVCQLNSEQIDESDVDGTQAASQGMHYDGSAANNSRLYALVTGWHDVIARVTFAANATGARGIRVTKNGITRGAYVFITAVAGGVYSTILASSYALWLEAGEYVEMEAWQDSGAPLTCGSSAAFREQNNELVLARRVA